MRAAASSRARGQPVEPQAELVDGRGASDLVSHASGSVDEELDRLLGVEGREVELCLGADAQRLAARDDQPETRRGTDDGREGGSRVRQQLLEVVEHDVRPLAGDPRRDRTRIADLGPERLGERGDDPHGIA